MKFLKALAGFVLFSILLLMYGCENIVNKEIKEDLVEFVYRNGTTDNYDLKESKFVRRFCSSENVVVYVGLSDEEKRKIVNSAISNEFFLMTNYRNGFKDHLLVSECDERHLIIQTTNFDGDVRWGCLFPGKYIEFDYSGFDAVEDVVKKILHSKSEIKSIPESDCKL